MLPIPGTGKVAHLEQNVGAAAIRLSDDDYAMLDGQWRDAAWWRFSRSFTLAQKSFYLFKNHLRRIRNRP